MDNHPKIYLKKFLSARNLTLDFNWVKVLKNNLLKDFYVLKSK